ncbi:ATP-binding protein [Actinokineospora auranticolor]|uniref:Histidine kinase/HSP90-like ATPase domain-containing protein n=1 Tax=Actinokineospora auranticolor TaxID=155976 RepID=A0A2S6GPE5_9PSEU|nr:ATP-binding protein [Actinokineospora auranticolor]PPK67066.1 hypothetical protein CLV40_10863 [Actinokineospora auranticolor]
MDAPEPAVFSTTVPARAEQLAPLRRTLRGWLTSRRVPRPVRHDVVLAAHEAVSDAIDQGGADRGTTVTLHLDHEVLVLTAVDHFTWTATAHPTQADRGLRVISRVAERVDLSVDDDRGSLTAYFAVRGDRR